MRLRKFIVPLGIAVLFVLAWQSMRWPGVLAASWSMCGSATAGKPVRESTGSSAGVTEKSLTFLVRKVTT